MNLSSRETMLAWGTMAALLAGATFLLGRTKVDEWKQIGTAVGNLENQIKLSEKLVGQRESWVKRLDKSMEGLQAYPQGLDVTPKLLESVENMARNANLKLDSLSPNKENQLGEVSEVAVKCSWQGDLEATVRFLYSLEVADGLYKIRNLTVAPTGKDGNLKGVFVVDCAYTRAIEGAAAPLKVVPVPAP